MKARVKGMAALAGLAGALFLSGCDPYEFPSFVTGAEKIDSWEVDERGWWHAQLPEGTKSSHFFVNGQRRARPHVPCGGCFYVDDMPAHTNSEGLAVRAREALGEPGDWHLDSSGELTYVPMPGENPATAEAYLCVRDNIVVIDGATNLVVRGVTFAYNFESGALKNHGTCRMADRPSRSLAPMRRPPWLSGTRKTSASRTARSSIPAAGGLSSGPGRLTAPQ